MIIEQEDEIYRDPQRITASISYDNGVVAKRSKESGGSNGPTASKKISEESKNEHSRSKKSSSDQNSNGSGGEPFKSPFMIIR